MVEPDSDSFNTGLNTAPATVLIDTAELSACLDEMAQALVIRLTGEKAPITWVGLETGGVRVAEALYQRLPGPLAKSIERGELDANFYRDDFGERGLHASRPSRMPLSLDAHCVVLVDDVLHTGRTARAAMNALFDLGRPRRVLLVTLLERTGRELPITADITGRTLEASAGHKLTLAPDALRVIEVPA